jgi:hypothetical protein
LSINFVQAIAAIRDFSGARQTQGPGISRRALANRATTHANSSIRSKAQQLAK